MAPTAARRRDLSAYDAKRDFGRTPEPDGAHPHSGDRPGGIFVVQRHRARRLHYDLRLEVDGVLASWAVPKGPTLDPATRSLAVQVEDHPMEYADFEGVIPAGEYGGGDVIVWDRGTWTPARTDDPAAAISGGELHFDLSGEKLAGRFVLVRTGADGRGRNQWLLLHKRDDAAAPGWNPEDHPRSVKSGRTNDEVRDAPAALWRSDLPAAEAEVPVASRGGPAPSRRRAGPRRRDPRATDAELRRLDALGAEGRWQVGGHRVGLSGLDDEVARPPGEPPLTVRDVVRHHVMAAPAMVPLLADQPAAVRRYRHGLGRPATGVEDLVARAPSWLRWGPPTAGADADADEALPVLDGAAALAWVTGGRGFSLFPRMSTTDAPTAPRWVVIGVEPGASTAPTDVALVGRLFGTALDHLGLVGGVKADGVGGLEVWVPLRPTGTFVAAARWAAHVAGSVAASVPDLVGVAPSARARGTRLRLVHHQRGAYARLVPYGIVGRRAAPVSVPLFWEELDGDDPPISGWSVRNVRERLAVAPDPWAGLADVEQALPDT